MPKMERENVKLKSRVKELERFLRWCIANGATDKDILLALDPKMSCKEWRRIVTTEPVAMEEFEDYLCEYEDDPQFIAECKLLNLTNCLCEFNEKQGILFRKLLWLIEWFSHRIIYKTTKNTGDKNR